MFTVLTHPGTRHADEVLATAWLEYKFGEVATMLFSYNPTPEQLADPNVHVLDIGRQNQPELNNRDHHQDGNLPATNLMVLRDFPHSNPLVQEKIIKFFFDYTDKVDRGEIVETLKKGETFKPTYNTLIRNMNAIPGTDAERWEICMAMTRPALRGVIAAAEKAVEDETRWEFEVDRFGHYAIHDSTNIITGWNGYAEEEGIKYLITPNVRGGYQIISRDSKLFNIPTDPRQNFRHNSGFLANYPDRDTAIAHAKEL